MDANRLMSILMPDTISCCLSVRSRTPLLVTMRTIRNPRGDVARSSDHDFWKRQFETGGNLPRCWFGSAFDLLTAADVLDRFKGDLRGEIIETMRSGRHEEPKMTRRRWERMSVETVSPMLRAMAIECLLKALWLKHGGMLAKDGRYVGVSKKNEHRLHDLAKAVSQKGYIVFTKRELELLEQASYWITSGRYPIQSEYSYLVPFRRPDGTLAARQHWRGDPREELKVLTAKLQTALGIEMKFESE